MEDMAFIKATTKFRSDVQYLKQCWHYLICRIVMLVLITLQSGVINQKPARGQ